MNFPLSITMHCLHSCFLIFRYYLCLTVEHFSFFMYYSLYTNGQIDYLENEGSLKILMGRLRGYENFSFYINTPSSPHSFFVPSSSHVIIVVLDLSVLHSFLHLLHKFAWYAICLGIQKMFHLDTVNQPIFFVIPWAN